MKVKKRNGTLEEVSFDKVINRLKKLCNEEPAIELDIINIVMCLQDFNPITA